MNKLNNHPLVKFRASYPLIGLILTVSLILMGMVLFLHFWKGIPIGKLTKDPTRIGGLPWYAGFLSQIGIFFWSASATVCFFSVTVISGYENHHQFRRFLLISGLLTLFLGLDDAFRLHEHVLPHFGLPQTLVYISYAIFVLFYLFKIYPVIIETDYVLMAASLFFFAVSVILDVLNPPGINPYFFEDGAKLIGLLSWLVYFFKAGEYSVNLYSAQQIAANGRHKGGTF